MHKFKGAMRILFRTAPFCVEQEKRGKREWKTENIQEERDELVNERNYRVRGKKRNEERHGIQGKHPTGEYFTSLVLICLILLSCACAGHTERIARALSAWITDFQSDRTAEEMDRLLEKEDFIGLYSYASVRSVRACRSQRLSGYDRLLSAAGDYTYAAGICMQGIRKENEWSTEKTEEIEGAMQSLRRRLAESGSEKEEEAIGKMLENLEKLKDLAIKQGR